jgi:aminopeptidase N
MTKLTASSDDGVVIDLYYFPKTQPAKGADGSAIDGAQHSLDTARGAINLYSRLYGPAPFKRIVVVEADFPDGMEFSGLVFVGHQWFAAYDGKPDSWVTMITAHEVAHQWWYSLVGNDQSTAPYLDESLAIYSEVLYMEDRYPALVPWWWSYRIKLWQPIGSVDSTVYDFQGERLYINAVYLRGALMLQEIREKIGNDAFFKWLHDYETANEGKIATPLEFWGALAESDYAKTSEIRARYLHQPDPLHPPTATPATAPATGAATQPPASPVTQAATIISAGN